LNDCIQQLGAKKDLLVCVMICSSTGNGDMPDNGDKFSRFLRTNANALGEGQTGTLLSHVWFTILGLGSTDYSKY